MDMRIATVVIKFKPSQRATVINALKARRVTHPQDRNRIDTLLAKFDIGYESARSLHIAITFEDWPLLSRALRPGGSNPAPGTPEAQQYALYLWMLQRHRFRLP